MYALIKAKRTNVFLSMILALSLLLGMSALSAAPPESTALPIAGEPGYASLHTYMSPTSIQGVYRVMTTLTLAALPPQCNDVVIILNGRASFFSTAQTVAGAPWTFGPDNYACRVPADFEWQACKQLIVDLFDPAKNLNAYTTRISLVNTGFSVSGGGANYNDARIWSEWLDYTGESTLLQRADDYHANGAAGRTSNITVGPKALQRADQLLTAYDQTLSFTPTGAYTTVARSNYPAGDDNWSVATPALAAATGQPSTLRGADDRGLWYENPLVAGKRNVAYNKFIVGLGTLDADWGSNENGTSWSLAAPLISNYVYALKTPPAVNLADTSDAPYSYKAEIDSPVNYAIPRTHKWMRYVLHQLSDEYRIQNGKQKEIESIYMLGLWRNHPTLQNEDNSAMSLDVIDIVSNAGTYAEWAATPVANRTYARYYIDLVDPSRTDFARSTRLGGGSGSWYESRAYWQNGSRVAPAGYPYGNPAGAYSAGTTYNTSDCYGAQRFAWKAQTVADIVGQNDWGDWCRATNVDSAQGLWDEIAKIVEAISFQPSGNAYFELNEEYTIYKIPNESLFKLSNSNGGDAGTIQQSGNDLHWKIADMPKDESTLTLVYYVKLDEEAQNTGLYYPLTNNAWFIYQLSGTTDKLVRYFPVPYASGTATKSGEEPSAQSSPMEQDGSKNTAQGGLTPIVGGLQQGSVPYTPSVTPAAVKIENEALEESSTSIPVTKTSRFKGMSVMVGCMGVIGVVVGVKKKRMRDS